MPRRNPDIDSVVNLLPSDGKPISHAAWMELVRDTRIFSLKKATQLARRSGDVIFEIGDPADPAGTLTVRRAFIAAAPAAPFGTVTTPKAGGS